MKDKIIFNKINQPSDKNNKKKMQLLYQKKSSKLVHF